MYHFSFQEGDTVISLDEVIEYVNWFPLIYKTMFELDLGVNRSIR